MAIGPRGIGVGHVALAIAVAFTIGGDAVKGDPTAGSNRCTALAAREFDAAAPAPGVDWTGSTDQWDLDASRAGGWCGVRPPLPTTRSR